MEIRNARPEDAQFIAPLIIQAMEDMAKKFTQSENLEKAFPLFEYFVAQKANQYSFENTLVAVENKEVAGSVTAYDGAKLLELRKPFLTYLQTHFGYNEIPEEETQAGELYLDTVSVHPNFQGKGIGGMLIQAMLEKAKLEGFSKVGLLVDLENPSAKKLYVRIGFKTVGLKPLMGGQYEHLVFELK